MILKAHSFFFFFFLFAFQLYGQYPLFKQVTANDGFSANKVFQTYHDRNGFIWLSTDKGIFRFSGNKFSLINSELFLDTEVLKFVEDGAGKMWMSSSNGKLFYFKGGKIYPHQLVEQIESSVSTKIINHFVPERNDKFWFSTVINHGLIFLYNKEFSFALNEPSAEYSYYVYQLPSEQFIWGSSGRSSVNNRLRVIFNNHFLNITLSSSGSGFSKSCFLQLADGSFLFSKDHEVIHFNKNTVISRAFFEKSVECLFEDSEGKIWAGLYSGGVVCFPAGNLNSATINYLGDKTISGICQDNKGDLWFAAMEAGLLKLPAVVYPSYSPPEFFTSISKEKTSNKEVVKSDNTDPIVLSVAEVPQVGLDSIPVDTLPPVIHISGFKIFNRDTSIHDFYKLNYDQNFIRISFFAFSSDKSQKLQYKYMLEGIDPEWIYSSNNQVQYTTLPAGNYRFLVSAMNNKGIWSENAAVIKIQIDAPFWETWWFRGSIGSIITSSVFLLFFFRIKTIKNREREKTSLSKKISDLELQALRAQMNPHFVFNTLSSIQHFISQNESEAATVYLSKFAKLMRRIMENSRKKFITVKDEIEALELYLELEKVRCRDKFSYSIQIDKDVDQEYDEIPSMLIQPYVENAIWHGLMNKSDKGNILISINKKDDLLLCIVEDNGVGREASGKLKNSGHKSLGMSVTKERLEILNAINNSNLSAEIIDLYKPDGEAAGTRVEIYVPSNLS
jgi:hypothetical protein